MIAYVFKFEEGKGGEGVEGRRRWVTGKRGHPWTWTPLVVTNGTGNCISISITISISISSSRSSSSCIDTAYVIFFTSK